MGLDVGFYVKGRSRSIADFKNHWELFYMFCDQRCMPVDGVSSDFWVNDETLDGVEQLVLETEPSIRAARTFSEDNICLIMSAGEDAYAWRILKPAYLQIIRKLRSAIRKNGPLVCSWSA
jgi:hypothetical protein